MSGAYFEDRPMRCRCGLKWSGHLAQNLVVEVWVAQVRSLRCPACGKGPGGIFLCYEADDLIAE